AASGRGDPLAKEVVGSAPPVSPRRHVTSRTAPYFRPRLVAGRGVVVQLGLRPAPGAVRENRDRVNVGGSVSPVLPRRENGVSAVPDPSRGPLPRGNGDVDAEVGSGGRRIERDPRRLDVRIEAEVSPEVFPDEADRSRNGDRANRALLAAGPIVVH